ncbi:MAG: tetratricopeptide repeat protein [Maritimibacter sp.]|nr:tetratricopeptide repeat protein [Maritimibacter sp.]
MAKGKQREEEQKLVLVDVGPEHLGAGNGEGISMRNVWSTVSGKLELTANSVLTLNTRLAIAIAAAILPPASVQAEASLGWGLWPVKPVAISVPHLVQVQAQSEAAMNAILRIQSNLAILGLYDGQLDGVMGPGTVRGLNEFYDRAGLTRDFNSQSESHLVAAGRIAQAGRLSVDDAIERAPDLVRADEAFQNARQAFQGGDYARAVQYYSDISRVYAALLGQEHERTLGVLSNMALSMHFGGDYSDAEMLHRQILSARERTLNPDDPAISESLHNLGMSLFSLGRFPEAESFFRRSHAMMDRTFGSDDPNTIASLSELASSIDAQRRPAEAEPLYRRAIAGSEKNYGPDHPATLVSVHNLGICLERQGKYAEAEMVLRRAAETRTRVLGETHPETLRSYNVLAGVMENLGRFDEAETMFRRVLSAREEKLGREHPDTLISLGFLGNALMHAERYSEAADIYARALGSWEKILGLEHPDTLRTAHNLFRAHLFAGNVEKAAAAMVHGIEMLPDFFASEGNVVFVDGTQNLPADLAHYLYVLSQGILEGANNADLGFQLQGWQSYGRMDVTLTDLAARLSAATGEEAAMLRALQEARNSMEAARQRFISSFVSADGSDGRRNDLTAALSTAEQRYRVVVDKMARDFPALSDLQLPRSLSVPEAQSLLRPGEGLVAYALVDDRLYAWFVTPDKVTWWYAETTPADLSTRVSQLRAAADFEVSPAKQVPTEDCALRSPFSGMERRSFDLCAAQKMQDLLLGGFDLTGIEELIVVPDGPLEQLPFSLLVTGTDADGSPHWLIEDLAVSTLPTTSSLRALRSAKPARSTASRERLTYLGLAPVTFGDQVDALALRSGNYDLPSTAAEVQFISAVLSAGPQGAVIGRAASEAFVRKIDLSKYNVISFATHALLSREAEKVSGGVIREPALLLHPGDGQDGFLTATEAASLRLDADWVLLSACNTAAGDAEDAEGLSGLARAFFFAGAKALLVSHWGVQDDAAMALMTETMQRSADGRMSRAQALRQAMLTVMNSPDQDYRHPFFWAPFALVGESQQ